MSRVMISYRNVDGQQEFATSLEKALADAGIETWLDSKDIPPSSYWEDEIFKGIINSDYVLLCLTPEYFESETCLFECYVARGYGKTLLPIIAPYDGNVSVLNLISAYEGTRGIDHLNIINFNTREVVGLIEDHTLLMQRLIKAITEPISPDADYDVVFSFKKEQAIFATQIADDLNKAGIKSFIHTRALDVGVDWRRASWNAALKAKIHIVILSPDVGESEYIRNEVLVMRTKKDTQFIPILAKQFVNDKKAMDTIRQTFNSSANLSILSKIQWYIPSQDYPVFIDNLIKDVRAILSGKDG